MIRQHQLTSQQRIKLLKTSNQTYYRYEPFLSQSEQCGEKLNKELDLQEISSGNRKIKPKMIAKLLGWMEKICHQTLQFQDSTFETAIGILLQYLSLVDEPVSNLQLLGCVSLFLSSKLNQPTIIAAQSYAECSLNIFTKAQLEQKEIQVFTTIGHKFPSLSVIKSFFDIHGKNNSQFSLDRTEELKIVSLFKLCFRHLDLICLHPKFLLDRIFTSIIEHSEHWKNWSPPDQSFLGFIKNSIQQANEKIKD